ncbi:hypothetical protein GCM10009555_100850 [Acrocarpospora macrocephala]|uniref:Uncharacterized protein n=2 Tax=Acrocarpospora macrocephala TaxID=150177 RepID=A0A5M3WXT2_9ACTN|nr:hypothetical protein Amac_078820 [Acrocarpospora macrocephala]
MILVLDRSLAADELGGSAGTGPVSGQGGDPQDRDGRHRLAVQVVGLRFDQVDLCDVREGCPGVGAGTVWMMVRISVRPWPSVICSMGTSLQGRALSWSNRPLLICGGEGVERLAGVRVAGVLAPAMRDVGGNDRVLFGPGGWLIAWRRAGRSFHGSRDLRFCRGSRPGFEFLTEVKPIKL